MTQFKTEPQRAKVNLEPLRKEARIAQISVSTVTGHNKPVAHVYGDGAIDKETVFGAASLSKPVFSYLVLKLVEAGTLSLQMKGLNYILSFQFFCKQQGFKWKSDEEIQDEDIRRINAFTPQMILAHQTGFDLSRSNQVNHQYEPGDNYYRYSGLPLFYLQKVIEKLHEPQLALMSDVDSFAQNTLYVSFNPPNLEYTIVDLNGVRVSDTLDLKTLHCDLSNLTQIQDLNPYLPQIFEELGKRGHTANLETLAKKYVFNPLKMNHSSFGENPCAANSLNTTAEDYALFVQAWMNDKELQFAFAPQISMTQDPWAQAVVPNKERLTYVAECLGFQLEVDGDGNPLTAFKTGDMGPWRGWVAIDLAQDMNLRKATVYFAKGPELDGNGHVLAETLLADYQLTHGLYWFREKYGFATGLEEHWEAAQKARCSRGMGYQDQSPRVTNQKEELNNVVDSTQKMFQLMPPKPQPELKAIDSQHKDGSSQNPMQKIESHNQGSLPEEQQYKPFYP